MKDFNEVPWWKPESAGMDIRRVTEVINDDYLYEGEVTTLFEEKIAHKSFLVLPDQIR